MRPLAPSVRWQPPRHLAVLMLLCLAALALPPAAAAEETGSIRGRVVNGTAGAGPPAGATVSLYAVRDRTVVSQQSQTVDAQGAFAFQGLDTAADLLYLVVADYHGIAYPLPQLLRPDDPAAEQIEISVYETTTDAASIAFERANILVASVTADQVEVLEMGSIVNSGDRTYIGDEEGVLRLPLPAGATSVSLEAGPIASDPKRTDEGIVTRDPLVPGRQQIALRYLMPVTGPVLDLSKPLLYPVGTFTLYLPATGLQASSPQLLLQGGAPTELGGQRFQVFSGQNLAAGSRLEVRVTGLPSQHWQLQPEQLAAATLGGAFFLGAVAVLLMRLRGGSWMLKGRPPAAEAALSPQPSTSNAAEQERWQLVLELAELDNRFAAGELPEEQYRQRRDEGKRRLLALTRELHDADAAS